MTAADYTFWLARHQETATDGEGAADSPFEQYCELDRVLRDGVFFAAGRLYGLTFAPRPDLRGYHPDVAVFEVSTTAVRVGPLYLADLYARSTKRGGAWMTSFVEQSREQGTKPVVVNVMNIPHLADGQPTLLSLDLLMTLFHEFGHALHGLLSDVRFRLAVGHLGAEGLRGIPVPGQRALGTAPRCRSELCAPRRDW